MKPKSRVFGKLIAGLAVVTMSASVAQAAIVIQNTDFVTGVGTISGFSLSGGTKLVVTTGGENGTVASITFDGQALTSIENIITGDAVQNASIWYLDNPTASSGDIVVTFAGSHTAVSSGFSALSISGAASGFLDSSGATGLNSGTLTIDVGSLVLGSFSTNADTGSLINPGDPSTDIFSANIGSSGGANAASAYFIEPDPATRTSFGFTGGAEGNRPVAAAVSFAAVIPEPASGLMVIAGAAGLCLRRRRIRG